MVNGIWDLVMHDPIFNVIGNKWVFHIKRNSNGLVLVAKGFPQRPSVNYTETFILVIRPQTIKLVLTMALSRVWSLCQMGVNNAFLHGTLTEDMYMRYPSGIIHPQFPSHVCKLKKALYGLK
ncbi:hypothetical protein L6164_026217 [Bauhinia variegata]|uniref:Uncharacterized protein n=1 Tax=Bauhinia variegata TaxID=167791 RepID=A0ACB9LQA0_BAUVA|nr:hypothetical protein L6164_026217 [Bauhinia variegata]